MGYYFVMSVRFNKCTALDFGLVPIDENTAIDANDGSIWIKTNLYDFGWGKENGYYRYPMLAFKELFELILYSEDEYDAYGAASIVLERYSDELLVQCEYLMRNQMRKKDFEKVVAVFNLKIIMNRSSPLQKPYTRVKRDFERWKKVSEAANKL